MSARYIIIAAAVILFAGALLYAADHRWICTNETAIVICVPSKVAGQALIDWMEARGACSDAAANPANGY